MATHPVNLALRLLLELVALVAMGIWGWHLNDTWFRYLLVAIVPVFAAIVWGTFAVPNDPSRSGKAPIKVPGALRLGLEFVFFVFAIWIFFDLEYTRLMWIMCSTVFLHYVLSYDRIKWLLVK